MKRRHPLIRVATALLSTLVACGDDAGGGAGGGGGGDADGAGAGGPGAGTGAGGPGSTCGIDGATVIAAPRKYGDGSVIPRLVVDGDELYFNTLDEVYRVPRAGGEPARVYPPEPRVAVYPAFWLRGDELVVGTLDELLVVPRAGGAVERTLPLPLPYFATLSGVSHIELAPDGDTFFAKHDDDDILSDDPPSLTYYRYDIASESPAILLEETPIGHGKLPVLAGDFVYVAHAVADELDPDDDRPDELYRIPSAGGAAELVPLTGTFTFDLLGADDTHLFLGGSPTDPGGNDFGGLYRLPLDGGAPEKLVDQYLAGEQSTSELVNLPERVLVRLLDTVHAIPHGSGEATALLRTSCEVHAFTAVGSDGYLAVFDEGGEESSILHVPLP